MRSCLYSRVFRLVLPVVALCWSEQSSAEIYKFVDENGHVTYTNMPGPGARKLDLNQPAGSAAAIRLDRRRSAAFSPTPGAFPRVDPGTQRKRDDMRRQLLVEELNSEQRNLSAAQSAYARRPPGADLNSLIEAVHLHQKNIEMLNKELGHIR